MSTEKRNIHKYISDTYGLEARRSIRIFVVTPLHIASYMLSQCTVATEAGQSISKF